MESRAVGVERGRGSLEIVLDTLTAVFQCPTVVLVEHERL